MNPTALPSRPDPTRTGAVWVTGTGAFLLLAAAAVFTAMRWEQIPDAAKLGALGLATGAFLLAGRTLKATLPATAGALFHLGAFLVPLDVAAVGVRAELDWSRMLLAQGVAATITFGWAAVTERSVVLRWSFAAAAVVLAGGIGATTDVPAALVLAGFAGVALAVRRLELATSWAAVAGTAPLLTFAEQLTMTGAGTVERLGLTGEQPRALAVVTGLGAAVVLAAVGRRRDDVGLVLIGVALATVGVTASWTGAEADTGSTLVGLATVFLGIELVAFVMRRDPFWRVPTGIVAQVAGWLAGPATLLAALPVLFAPAVDSGDGRAALAAGTLAVGWLAADRRRGARGSFGAAVAMATCTASAVALGFADDAVLAATLAGMAALATLSGHRAGTLVAVAAAVWAPVVALDSAPTLVAVGMAGTLILSEAAVRRTRSASAAPGTAPDVEERSWLLAATALAPGGIAVAGYIALTGDAVAGLVGGAIVATTAAALCDRGRVAGDLPLGTLARVGAVAVLAGTTELAPHEVAVVALAVAGLSAGDALRRRDPRIGLGASLAVPVGIAALAQAADLSVPSSGVALTISAAVLTGLGALLQRRWAFPVLAAAAISVVGGLALASGTPSAFADAVMITSGIGMAAAVERGRLDGLALSGIGLTAGAWLRLADADVMASEPYLFPIAVLLLGAGLRARSMGTSSWVAYGPVIALLGGSALVERISGGPGWHGLVAGAVGVVAVAAGGQRRLAAPLFLGTGLLVALVGYETIAVTAALPTWTWLAIGGTVLLGAGVAMERHDLGPLETGRRLVDVVDEHFE